MSIYAEKLQEAYAHGEKIIAEVAEMYDDALEMYKNLSKVYKELSDAYKELAESYKELAGTYKEAAAKSKKEVSKLQVENKAVNDLLAEILQKEDIGSELREKIEALLKKQG